MGLGGEATDTHPSQKTSELKRKQTLLVGLTFCSYFHQWSLNFQQNCIQLGVMDPLSSVIAPVISELAKGKVTLRKEISMWSNRPPRGDVSPLLPLGSRMIFIEENQQFPQMEKTDFHKSLLSTFQGLEFTTFQLQSWLCCQPTGYLGRGLNLSLTLRRAVNHKGVSDFSLKCTFESPGEHLKKYLDSSPTLRFLFNWSGQAGELYVLQAPSGDVLCSQREETGRAIL